MKPLLPNSFLLAGRRALASYLQAIRQGIEVEHDHSESASSQIPLAAIPTGGLTSAKLGLKAATSRKLRPTDGSDAASGVLTVPSGTSTDPDLSLTLPSGSTFAVWLLVRLEKVRSLSAGRQLRVQFKIGGVAQAWFSRLEADDRGLAHDEFPFISLGGQTLEVQYVANAAGIEIEGVRELHFLAFRNGSI